ncbi:hypothetical protein COCNU_03G004010 [Cocos nucifera]|uniref:Signal peptidase complex subunit 2 n=1 Tax=Cocos nucifera TaxID=13894 RepID=A0A8K0I1S1_COCNU|nr:hypothetical protein COCNU_03G004010 [Cocos nucifera]
MEKVKRDSRTTGSRSWTWRSRPSHFWRYSVLWLSSMMLRSVYVWTSPTFSATTITKDGFEGSFNSTGLIVSSKLPRFSDMYTLTVASADPKSISANKHVQLTKSVTKWFTKEGVLVEGLFRKHVERLIDDYNGERKNK